MSYVDLRYKLDEKGIELMRGCAGNHLIDEIKHAVTEAFREIVVTLDHNEDTGICRIVAVNNHNLCGCP